MCKECKKVLRFKPLNLVGSVAMIVFFSPVRVGGVAVVTTGATATSAKLH